MEVSRTWKRARCRESGDREVQKQRLARNTWELRERERMRRVRRRREEEEGDGVGNR